MPESRWDEAKRELVQSITHGAYAAYAAYAPYGSHRSRLKHKDFTKALFYADQALSYADPANEPGRRALRATALLGIGRRSEASREASLVLKLAPGDYALREGLKSVGLPLGLRVTSHSSSWYGINFIVKGVLVNEGESMAPYTRIIA